MITAQKNEKGETMAEISSTEPVLDLKDRTVIVTGGSKGIYSDTG